MTGSVAVIDVRKHTDGVVVVPVDVQIQLTGGGRYTMDQKGVGTSVGTGKHPGTGVVAITHVEEDTVINNQVCVVGFEHLCQTGGKSDELVGGGNMVVSMVTGGSYKGGGKVVIDS